MSTPPLSINYAKNFTRNITTNIIALIINTLVGLLLVPFYLDTLGPAAYALIPLATTVTSYVTLIIDTINAAVARFLTIELQCGKLQTANETYSTSFTILIGTVLICIPIGVLVSILAPTIFETGTLAHAEVILFFILIIGSALISTLRSNFMAILFSYNRLDLRNAVTISQTVLQVGLIVVLFLSAGVTLTAVGFAYLTAAFTAFILAYVLARMQRSGLHYQLRDCRRNRIKELGSLTGFLLFDRFGCMLQGQIALVVVNIYFGAVVQAEYSLVITWCSFLIVLAGVVTTTISPKVYSLIGANDDTGAVKFCAMFTKIVGLLAALPIALLCIFAPQIMTIWVGAEYAKLAPLVWCLIPITYFSITISSHNPLAIAKNRMEFPAFLNVAVGLLYLVLALVLPVVFDIGYFGVAFAYMFTIFINYGFFSPIYYARIAGAPTFLFVRKNLYGVVGMICLMAAGVMYTHYVLVDSILLLIVSGFAISAAYLLSVWVFVFSKEEKRMAVGCFPEWVQKFGVWKKLIT